MSDVFHPFAKLIRIVILGRAFEVPENNLLLRQMQYVAPDIGYGQYCWNAECRNCEVSYRQVGGGAELTALACRLNGLAGMRITKLAFEIRYNMIEVLSKAPKEE